MIKAWSRKALAVAWDVAQLSPKVAWALLQASWAAASRLWHHAGLRRGAMRVGAWLGSIGRVGVAAGLIAGLAVLAVACFTHRVPAASIGVRQMQWGGAGVEPRDRATGLHFSLRGWHAWHELDRRTHFASFGTMGEAGSQPMLDLRTKEGNEIQVAVVVPYRIVEGEAHELVRDGLKSTYGKLVEATIADVLMRELADLSADDVADTDRRLGRMGSALPRLNRELAGYHVRASSIQIHDVRFWKQYEAVLQKKQLTRQMALLAEAATLVEEEMSRNALEKNAEASEARIRGEMDKQIERLRSEQTLAISQIKSDMAGYDSTRRAAADARAEQLEAEGEAELYKSRSLRERLVNEAYDSSGGRIELARQAAEKLRIARVTLNSNDPDVPSILDLDELVRLLVGSP